MTVIERETEVDVTFHFVFHFPVLHVVLNKRCQRQTGVFTLLYLCRVLLRDAVRCSACTMRNNLERSLCASRM